MLASGRYAVTANSAATANPAATEVAERASVFMI
jgi:hypothetical protein